jgi:threonine/homoserine/homoserine lactone efflux protein
VLAFVLGFAVAAPMGPVNMYAIRRGIVGHWPHTLACGLGSAAADLLYFGLALLGGQLVIAQLQSPLVQVVMAAAAAGILLPVGIMYLMKAKRAEYLVRDPKDPSYTAPPTRLLRDFITAFALTLLNPLGVGYWLVGASNWLPVAQPVFGWATVPMGLAGAAAGLVSWFGILAALMRFVPNRIGPRFFKTVNGGCGVVLIIFGAVSLAFAIQHAKLPL